MGKSRDSPVAGLRDYFSGCEAIGDPRDLDLNMIPGFRVRYEHYESLNSGYSFTASADLFDVNLVFFAFLDWFWTESVSAAAAIASPFITQRHFHLRSSFVLSSFRLLREKAAVVTETATGRSPAGQPAVKFVSPSQYKLAFCTGPS